MYERTIKMIEDRISSNNDNLKRYKMAYMHNGEVSKTKYDQISKRLNGENEEFMSAKEILITAGEIDKNEK